MTALARLRPQNLSFEILVPDRVVATLEELRPLFRLHWEEVGAHHAARPLNVNVANYQRAAIHGAFAGVLARHESRAIGYLAHFIRDHVHYQGYRIAVADVVYVLPEYRSLAVAEPLFRIAEEQLRARGCRAIYQASKIYKDLGVLLRHFDYHAHEVVYEKVLS